MANKRIKDLTQTATTLASDDYVAIDGASNGTRKIVKGDLVNDISSQVAGTYLDEANNLSDVASLDTSKLNLEVPDVGTAPNEVPLNGMLGDMAYQSSDGVSVAKLEVTDSVTDSLTIENDTAPTLYFERAGIPNAHIKAVDENGTEGGGIQLYSSEVRLRTGGTQHVTLDSSGRLGIGTASPGSIAHANADDLVIGDGILTVHGATIATNSSGRGYINFADGSGVNSYRGQITYDHSVDKLSLVTAGSTRWTINSSGNLVANGTAIDFGSGASTTLDDYEEGSFTPSIQFGGGETGITYSARNAYYTKIGRLVTVHYHIVLTSKGTSTGVATIVGGPFVSAYNAGGQGVSVIHGYSMASLSSTPFANLAMNSSTLSLWDTVASGRDPLTDANFTNTTGINCTLTFEV